jgi:hypothetical protein
LRSETRGKKKEKKEEKKVKYGIVMLANRTDSIINILLDPEYCVRHTCRAREHKTALISTPERLREERRRNRGVWGKV